MVSTVATHRLTSDVNNLTFNADEYMGTFNDDDVGIPFHHIGTSKLLSSFKSFLSNQLLHTPTIEKILVIACKFTQDNNIFFEFHSTFCVWRISIQGQSYSTNKLKMDSMPSPRLRQNLLF